MKFAPFIFDYIATDDWGHLENISDHSNPKEYLGFDIPLDLKDLSYNSPKWDELVEMVNDWVTKHNLAIISDEVVYYDLEKGYEDHEVVFSLEGRYYRTSYSTSWCWGPYRDGYPDDVKEVFKHTETVTITKYY